MNELVLARDVRIFQHILTIANWVLQKVSEFKAVGVLLDTLSFSSHIMLFRFSDSLVTAFIRSDLVENI